MEWHDCELDAILDISDAVLMDVLRYGLTVIPLDL